MPATSMRRRTARRTGSCCRMCSNSRMGISASAALLLGIARQTFRLRLRELGLHVACSVEVAATGTGMGRGSIDLVGGRRRRATAIA